MSVTDRWRSVPLYLWKTYFKIIDLKPYPGSLIVDFKCSGRVALGMNGREWRLFNFIIVTAAAVQIKFKFHV
jgi:hypothetical protein